MEVRKLPAAHSAVAIGTLVTRIDDCELRLDHLANKLTKTPLGLPAKCSADLVRATHQLDWLCRPIKRWVMAILLTLACFSSALVDRKLF